MAGLPIKMCLGKRSYQTRKMAEAVLHKAKKSGIIVTESMHSYRCPFCSKFHIGHQKKRS
jgi:glycerate-2-kinase